MRTATRISNWKYPVRSFALVAICLLGAPTVWADPSETRNVKVSFRDLNLSTQSGAAALHRRIEAAAKRACSYEATLYDAQRNWQNCVRPAVDAAVAKVNNPLLTAYHTHRSTPAATAMIGK